MDVIDMVDTAGTDVQSPVRNHYFHGKMMDAYHFQLETNYHNNLRALIARHVIGRGVVCGLNVVPSSGTRLTKFDLAPGVAIDAAGRIIVVPADVHGIKLPLSVVTEALSGADKPATSVKSAKVADSRHLGGGGADPDYHGGEDKPAWVQILLCYHECPTNPVPVLAGDCHNAPTCAPGTVREWFHLAYKAGRSERIDMMCDIPDLIQRGRISYHAIVDWVSTESCRDLPRNTCIPIADALVAKKDSSVTEVKNNWQINEIDIYRRPIAYTNRMLFEMFLDIFHGQHRSNR
jgi:hypothetical protein